MRVFAAIFALWLSGTCARAEPPSDVQAEVTQFGIYDGTVGGIVVAEGTAAGHVQGVDYHFTSNETTVPACKGVRFGFEYRITGSPAHAQVSIRSVTVFPGDGVRNPRTGQLFARSEYVQGSTIGDVSLKGYSLDEDWELVPGVWLQQIWFGTKLLAEKSFTLTKTCGNISTLHENAAHFAAMELR